MKRLMLLLAFLLCASSIMANPLDDCYPDKILGFGFFEKNDFNKFLGLSDNTAKVVNYVNEVADNAQKILCVDFKEQVKHVGFFVIPDDFNEPQIIYFIEGNFSFSPTKSVLNDVKNMQGEKAEFFLDFVFSGKKVHLLEADHCIFTCFSENIILFCDYIPFDLIYANRIKMQKAPKAVSELLEKHSNLVVLEKSLLNNLTNNDGLGNSIDISKLRIASCFYENNLFNIGLSFDNENDADLFFNSVNNKLKSYSSSLDDEYNKIAKAMDGSVSGFNSENISLIYQLASKIDFINSIETTLNGKNIEFIFSGDKLTFINQFVTTLHNILMPKYREMNDKAAEKVCFYTQKEIVKAIEAYNDEHLPGMTTLDIRSLNEEKFLSVSDSTIKRSGCHEIFQS